MDESLKRNCPTCKKELIYKTKKSFANAISLESSCISCCQKNNNKKGKLKYSIPKIGDKFDYWTVIESDLVEIKRGSWRIKCECKCGIISYVRVHALFSGKSKGCPCRAIDKNRERRNYIGDISETLWNRIKKSATIRQMEFDITKEYVWDLFLMQGKKCKLSNLDITIEKSINRKKGMSNITASLDRIDSSIGYIIGNVQWVHKDINKIKQDFNEEYFKLLCELITENNK